MTAGIFADCVFFIKVNLSSFKEKKRLKNIISSNGGSFSYVLNEKCTHIIAYNVSDLRGSHLKKIQKHQISVVDPDFIWKCIEEKQLIEKADDNKSVHVVPEKKVKNIQNYQKTQSYARDEEKNKEDIHVWDNGDPMEDESWSAKDFEVAKYSFLQKDSEVAVVELLSLKDECLLPYKISTRTGLLNGSKQEYTYFLAENSMKACERYELRVKELKNKGFLQKDIIPPEAMIFMSEPLQEVLLKEAINTTKLSQEVGCFVESIWHDAFGHLFDILSSHIESISLNDVSKAEGILLQLKGGLTTAATPGELQNLMAEFHRLIPHNVNSFQPITKKLISEKQELCQLIRDFLNTCETTKAWHMYSTFAKYQALRCKIEYVDPNTEEFLQVANQVLEKNYSNESFEVLEVYRIGRLSETSSFQSKMGNIRSLLHSSSASNFLGILSRGLLLPKTVVEEFGLERTDIGNLGSGIYFTDSISACVKYSKPSDTSGARLLVLCDVALGNPQDTYKMDFSITEPPSGLHSVHGVRRTAGVNSDFEDDEFVVYNRNQVKMRYAVRFSVSNDKVDLKPEFLFNENELELEQTPQDVLMVPTQSEDAAIDELPQSKPIHGGLQSVDGKQMPLEMIHVKAKVMDLIAQVVIFQTYKNKSPMPIEAKYVFPLDSSAAVCGFEAFINGKHIVGEVKEKQQAHQEYRSAIQEGHGAYLMDQDAPDVFTVSVGNLPPNSTVIIKITYITELVMSCSEVNFHIPGTVASWQKDKALNENIQDTVTKVKIDEGGAPKGCFCLDMSIEMPYKIENISSYQHSLKIKKTDCKAVVQTREGASLDENGFTLVISMTDAYLPRMWVEKHPDKNSEACMLVFHPEFESEYQPADVTICLDCSNSMEPCFQNAKLLALHILRSVHLAYHVNLILFGTTYKEFDICPKRRDNLQDLEKFIKMAKPDMGNTEFWKPLNSMCLLPPSTGIHKILLISDGQIQNEYPIFQILKRNVGKVRLFTCGVSATANRHMLRSLSQQSGGAFEFFEDKSKSSWDSKVQRQISRLYSPNCSAVSVKWRQFDHNAPDPLQAPSRIQALFSQDSLLVYGFIHHCTQATLKGLIGDKELDTMVSTTELQKTTGTMLHKLTARALIRDYEDGILGEEEDEHELNKRLKKMLIVELSKEYSLVTQFTSFIAVEKREADESHLDIEPNIQEIIASEDVDFLPYMDWDPTDPTDPTDLQMDFDSEESEFVEEPRLHLDVLECLAEEVYEGDFESAQYVLAASAFPTFIPLSPLPCVERNLSLAEIGAQTSLFSGAPQPQALSFDAQPYPPPPPLFGSPFPHAQPDSLHPASQRKMESKGIMQRRKILGRKMDVDMEMRPCGFSKIEAQTSLFSSAPQPQALSFDAQPYPPPPPPQLFGSPFPHAQPDSLHPAPQRKMESKGIMQRTKILRQKMDVHMEMRLCGSSKIGPQTSLFSSAQQYPSPPPLFGSPFPHAQPDSLHPALQRKMAFEEITLDSAAGCETEVNMKMRPCGFSKIGPQTSLFSSAQQYPSPPPPPLFGSPFPHAQPDSLHPAPQRKMAIKGITLDSAAGCETEVNMKMRLCGFSKRSICKRPLIKSPTWSSLSALQQEEGFWLLTPALGKLLHIDVPFLTDVFLYKKGICSLGIKGKDEVQKLIATLLVLQAIRNYGLIHLVTFKSLMKMDDSSTTSEFYPNINKAIKWARKAEQQYPGICPRLGLGKDWDSATKLLLRIEPIDLSSDLYPAVM
ncbi:protein mono-ADP-ribosyltransferase PARP4 [Spea bombifrons]|uniref:protein mono-ADP-ribosyltransferase PARP4 n=1 Tax=Spea bombifrons TaxID=233779 RepID=UPI00234B36D0|nr:protein mono-ADP-ribosyltransferase PARP4 [Spea bombifrons]